MRFSYPLIVDHGHLLLQLDQKIYLIDTGATLSILSPEMLQIAGKTYENSFNDQKITVEKLNSFLNKKIDGLIGADILVDFIITINVSKGTLEFDENYLNVFQGSIIPFELLHGVPVIDIWIEDNILIKAFLDTGAQLSYLDPSITKAKHIYGRQKDFHPSLGEFETDIFCIDTRFANKTLKVFFGNLPETLQSGLMKENIKAIIGFDLFNAYVVCIDYKNKQILLS